MDHHPPISPMPSSNYSSSSSIFSTHTTTSSTSTSTSFPITAVAIIGILATGFLLVSYYIFVIKCCLNWHRIDILLRRFSSLSGGGRSLRTNVDNPLLMMNHNYPLAETRGLDEAIIRSIPILQYKKDDGISRMNRRKKERSLCEEYECAVCLNEFQEEEKLRVIPNCGHVFHIDCIDIWLQNNANCPLCRTSISAAEFINNIPNFTKEDDQDYVVIEIAQENKPSSNHNHESSSSLLKVEEKTLMSPLKWKKKLTCVRGDECIGIRTRRHDKDEQEEQYFGIRRRSFSMDSASDPQFHLAIQNIILQQQEQEQVNDISSSSSKEGSNKVVRKPFFSFGHDRTSRNAVLPLPLLLHLET